MSQEIEWSPVRPPDSDFRSRRVRWNWQTQDQAAPHKYATGIHMVWSDLFFSDAAEFEVLPDPAAFPEEFIPTGQAIVGGIDKDGGLFMERESLADPDDAHVDLDPPDPCFGEDQFGPVEILPPQFTERGGTVQIPLKDSDVPRLSSGPIPWIPVGEAPPEMILKGKETILEEAARITTADRQRYYGHPADNHGNTAELWDAYLCRRFGLTEGRLDLTARDVCMMMILLKVSRDANAENRDNLVDICGYARNAEQVEERGQ